MANYGVVSKIINVRQLNKKPVKRKIMTKSFATGNKSEGLKYKYKSEIEIYEVKTYKSDNAKEYVENKYPKQNIHQTKYINSLKAKGVL